MSTSVSVGSPEKNTNSCVRPGVCETRTSALRPVSPLMRLDLPTFERPAKAISMPNIFGNDSTELAAHLKSHGRPNSLRPASISADENSDASLTIVRLGSPVPVVTERGFHVRIHVHGFDPGFHAAFERIVRRAGQGRCLGRGAQGQRGR